MKDDNKKALIKLLHDKYHCKSLSFHYSDDCNSYIPFWKYFPSLDYKKNSYEFHSGKRGDFLYYVISAGKNVGERHSLSIRSNNILIKSNTVLEQSGPSQICDSEIKKRIYGEILHRNMKQFIEVTRNEFIKNRDYKLFREDVNNVVGGICHELRKSYKIGQKVLKYIHEPFESIKEESIDSPLKIIEKQIQRLAGTKESQKLMQKARELYSHAKDDILEGVPRVSDYLRASNKNVLDFNGDGYILRVEKELDYPITEHNLNRDIAIVRIPLSTFDSEDILWVGETFNVRFVYDKDSKSKKAYSINFDKHTITINTFYQDFQKYSLSFLEVEMMLDATFHVITSDDPGCSSDIVRKCIELFIESLKDKLRAKYEEDTLDTATTLRTGLFDAIS
ncbi:MAG: hypothetical protein ACFFG0_45010 [Candidatus Thorarchaeota archaeon]